MTSMNLILITSLLYLALNASLAKAKGTAGVNFSFKSHSDWNSENDLTRGGDATINDNSLQLTSSSTSYGCSWAFYNHPIPLGENGEPASFRTHFSFIINATYGRTGDGLTFFIAPYPYNQPANSCGGLLGLFNSGNELDISKNQVVAVEFDTYFNDWDPQFYHVGIDVNSIYSVVVHKLDDYNITNGTLTHAWVDYSAGDQTLNVFMNYVGGSESPRHPILSYKLKLTDVLPSKVTVGLSATTGAVKEEHQILSWEFNSSFSPNTIKANSMPVILIALFCSIGAMLLLGGVGWFLKWRKKSLKKVESNSNLPKMYRHKDLVIATSNFADKNKLGRGSFGPVFKGYCRDRCDEVAVKKLAAGSHQGTKEFESESAILSKLRHPNLVELFGWCEEKGQLLLVYKYMPNGSLHSLLYDVDRLLLWHKRYQIILNLADALCYLHAENVVHRDIKPGNVLLDSSLNAKLSDFGLARLVDHSLSAKSTEAAGSPGYFAPELQGGNKIIPNAQSDVFSFGVVSLEIACGRTPFQNGSLVDIVWGHYGKSELFKAFDEKLIFRGEHEHEQQREQIERVMIVGLWCAHPYPSQRPTMEQAKRALKFDPNCEMPNLPRTKPPLSLPVNLDILEIPIAPSSEDEATSFFTG